MTSNAKIRVERDLSHAPEKVWKALTQAEFVAQWWASGSIEATVGHQFLLDLGDQGLAPCEVLEADPHSLFVIQLHQIWTLSWVLEATGAGCCLVLFQEGFELNAADPQAALHQLSAHWNEKRLPQLEQVLQMMQD
ncbi:MAG: hypothetical protein RLZZ158_1711 [Cyanobacteriota bacterium]|jgi:uncharacterized protein YndB with AHSA1/START domain